jgi:hypothetical protein
MVVFELQWHQIFFASMLAQEHLRWRSILFQTPGLIFLYSLSFANRWSLADSRGDEAKDAVVIGDTWYTLSRLMSSKVATCAS